MTSRFIFDATSTAVDLGKKFKEAKLLHSDRSSEAALSITVLANFSTHYLVNSIFTSLVFNEVRPNIYEAPFDQWEFELSNPASESYKRRSDYTLLALSATRLLFLEDRDNFECNLRQLLIRYQEASHSQIILVMPELVSESFDQTSFFYQKIQSIRTKLRSELKGLVQFLDINPLIMEFGFARWRPSKFLLSAKFACHPNCYPLYGNYLANYLLSLVRRPTRLIIVDLDNTLWEGVVGDVGCEGVGLDRDGTGYPYLVLQNYLLNLKRAGVLLALCSKNNVEVAKKVFDDRKEMILKFDDFVAHQINWEPKSENILKILQDLNLTTAGTMFIDDSRFEREEVRANMPGVHVPELPEEPESWCDYLSRSGHFTIAKITTDDIRKTEMYFAESRRKNEAAAHTDYQEFLCGLNLVITAERVGGSNFDRVHELIHKTNQFNLTTNRLSRDELQLMSADDQAFSYCYRLTDKYSDYGVIAVFIAKNDTGTWRIVNWLMSCRTIGRGVEDAVFNHFLSVKLSNRGCVLGEYKETDKNGLVSNLLDRMGFNLDEKTNLRTFTVGDCINPTADHIELINLTNKVDEKNAPR